jgi:hypothetical protein
MIFFLALSVTMPCPLRFEGETAGKSWVHLRVA